jgi:hypothetical protein
LVWWSWPSQVRNEMFLNNAFPYLLQETRILFMNWSGYICTEHWDLWFDQHRIVICYLLIDILSGIKIQVASHHGFARCVWQRRSPGL